jgi:hypothetical protein
MALSLRESVATATRLPQDATVLAARAGLLRSDDQELVKAIMIHGFTAAEVARMMGLSPRSVCNRIRKLTARLGSREFMRAARALPFLDPADAALARMRFCAGMSLRQISRQMSARPRPSGRTGPVRRGDEQGTVRFGGRTSPHVVRRRLDQVSAKIALINRMRLLSRRSSRELSPEALEQGLEAGDFLADGYSEAFPA